MEPASGDASFRRYLRVRLPGRTYVAMDAPPHQEDSARYVDVARRLRAIGINVPEVYEADLDRGFLLLEDLGTALYLDRLDEASADRLYGDALAALMVIQACGPRDDLPDYDASLLARELEIFREWLLGRHLGVELSRSEGRVLDEAFDLLIGNALEQPRVCVHRDYHSRNLLVTEPPTPGVLDFQDAVIGPVTYDPVSLLRDCYVRWPRERVDTWATGYFDLAVQSGVLRDEHEGSFPRWMDLMGVQRHLKAAGIFARLDVRDHKGGYLADIPRTLGYVQEVAANYPELAELRVLVERRVLPRLGV
ncbi:MAG: phosphotransferase [Chromatiales bacterium]|jgi:aminoglycoside/choline kinase family phosphotransferase